MPTLVKLEFNTLLASVLPVILPEATLPAVPVIDPAIGFVTARLVNVPTLVKLELTTLLARVLPVMFAPDTDPAEPFTLPTIVLVTVRFVKVPTLVKLELTTLLARVLPVTALAALGGIVAQLNPVPFHSKNVVGDAGTVINPVPEPVWYMI